MDCFRAAVPTLYPDDLGRGAFHERQLVKIGVFGDDHKIVLDGELPDREIVGAVQAKIPHVGAMGKNV